MVRYRFTVLRTDGITPIMHEDIIETEDASAYDFGRIGAALAAQCERDAAEVRATMQRAVAAQQEVGS